MANKKKEIKKVKALQISSYKSMMKKKQKGKKLKTRCCEKFKQGEVKRCGSCPCFDLLKKAG